MAGPNPFDQFDSQPQSGPVYGAPPKLAIPSGYAGDTSALHPIPGGPADPAHQPASAPSGYRFKGPNLEAIPGGPADKTATGDQLSPDALNAETTNWILTGKMSPLGMGNGPLRVQIENNRPLLLKKYGIDDNQLPAIQKEFQADSNSYNQRVQQLSFIQQALEGANQHTHQIAGYLRDMPAQTDSRGLNAISNYAQRQASGDTITQLDATIPLLKAEMAKIMTANPSGAAQLTDDARHEFDILESNASPHAKLLALQALRQMGQGKIDGVNSQIKSLGQRMNGGLPTYAQGFGGALPGTGNAPPPPPNGPLVIPGQTQAGFGLKADPRNTNLSPEQSAAYDAWWKANPNPTPRQLLQFGSTIGLNIPPKNAQNIITAEKQGRGISHDVQAVPDISDVRGGNNTATQDTINAVARGVPDTLSMGLLDKGVALADTVAKGGTFDQNLQRQFAISDYDQQHHPIARFTGQALGGGLIPMGDVSSLAKLSLKGGALGTAYGAGSSRHLGDVPQNAIMGGIAGAVIGPVANEFLGAGAAGRALAARNAAARKPAIGIPPLVDPQTGALNQPMEAMTPGQRVVHAEEYGVNLPADAAGGRSAAIIGKGLDLMPGSAGVMEDARRATENQVAGAADVVGSRFGSSRTLNEAGAELQRGANERIARSETVTGKAYNAIPISPNAPASTSNTVATLQQLTGRFQSNPDLANAVRDPKLATYLNALQNGNLNWEDLKQFRSIIGEKIGDMRFGESHSVSDLRALYAGLSEDMKASAAAQGPRALNAFNRANTLYRNEQQLIDGALTRLVGKDGQLAPEKAAAAVQAMTKGGKSTGDLKTLAQVRSATIRSGAWNEIAATLIRLGGQPVNSQGRDFNPQTFVNWYADMAEPARGMLFGNSDLRKSLDGFVAVNQRLMKVNGLRNTSNTAGSMTAAGTVGVMGGSLINPVLGIKLAGIAAGNFAMAKAWTNPAVVRWMTGYSKALASGDQQAVRSQIGRIGSLAATNPDLREPLIALQQRLANDNFTASSAASQPDNSDQRKNQR